MKELYPFKMSMNEKTYKDYISQFENVKMKFHKRVKEIEQNKLEKRKISSRKNKRTRNKSIKFVKDWKKEWEKLYIFNKWYK